jgi:hypothetical protein
MYSLFFVVNVYSQVHIASNYAMTMHNELKEIRKETFFTRFLEEIQYLHRVTEDTHVETSCRITELRTKF